MAPAPLPPAPRQGARVKYVRTYVRPFAAKKHSTYVRTLAPLLIVASDLEFVAPPGAGPGAGEGGAGPGPRAPGPYEIVPGPRAPVAGPVGDPRTGRRSSGPRSGRSRTCESHANIFSTYVNAVLPKGWAGEPPISKTRSWRTTVPQEPLTENGCSPGRAGDGGPKPRGWGMGAAMIFLRTSSHLRQWRSTTRAT